MDDKGAPLDGTPPPEKAGATPDGVSSFPPTLRRRVTLTLEETAPLWEEFRAGRAPSCPSDGGPLALSVDGANAYRLVCTQCGVASSWFEMMQSGLRDRVPGLPTDRDPSAD
jgi:hypothetical protein